MAISAAANAHGQESHVNIYVLMTTLPKLIFLLSTILHQS